jgi:hypothetical protein
MQVTQRKKIKEHKKSGTVANEIRQNAALR